MKKTLHLYSIFALGFIAGAALLLVWLSLSGLGAGKLVLLTDSNRKTYDGEALTDEGWHLRGSLKSGHRAEVIFRGSQTLAGESANEAELIVRDRWGTDVTSEYEVDYEFGTLTVDFRSLVVISENASKSYDGKPLTASGYEAYGLVAGHSASVVITGSITEIGVRKNTIETVDVYDFEGNNITWNYRIVIREGLLTVDGGAGSGSSIDSSESQRDRVLYSVYAETGGYLYLRTESYGDYNGTGWLAAEPFAKAVGDGWSAAYLTGFALEEAGAHAQTVRIRSFCGDYGLPYYLAPAGVAQTSDVRFSGETGGVYEAQYYAMIRNTGALASPYAAYEKEYRDFVYKTYLNIDQNSLAYMQGVIERERLRADDPDIVAAVAKYIQGAATYTGDYPAAMERESNVAIAFLEKYKQGVCRHYASAAVLLYRALGIPARYTVGALAKTKAGEWTDVPAKSAHAWVEVYLDGIGWVQVEVTGSSEESWFPEGGIVGEDTANGSTEKKALTLQPLSVRYPHDGTEHTAPAVLNGFQAYEEKGYTYRAEISGTRTEAGITETVIESVTLYDPLGNDVTERFDITREKGILQIYIKKVLFTSGDSVGVYGEPPTEPEIVWDEAHFPEGYTVRTAYREEALMPVGAGLNRFDVTVLNAEGEDVTAYYWVDYEFGTRTVTPLPITFKAGDAEKTYDGKALTCGEIAIVSGALLEGHEIGFYETEGSQTAVGRGENAIVHIAIHDSKGNNVTSNYGVELLPGTLTVRESE